MLATFLVQGKKIQYNLSLTRADVFMVGNRFC